MQNLLVRPKSDRRSPFPVGCTELRKTTKSDACENTYIALARPKGLELAKGDFKPYYLMLSNAAEVLRRNRFEKFQFIFC